MQKTENRPIIGITMGDPVGIGPEIVLLAMASQSLYDICKPCVIGDIQVLSQAKHYTNSDEQLNVINSPDDGLYQFGVIDVISVSSLDPDNIRTGEPTQKTGQAMVNYIVTAIDMTLSGNLKAMVTCPISKAAMKLADVPYKGHTELLAERTQSNNVAMMLAGDRLRVVLVTIHEPLQQIPGLLSVEKIINTISLTGQALTCRFGIKNPTIAVAGLNPHAGEQGLFGEEEKLIILPAIETCQKKGMNVSGPYPPDTLFHFASKGRYDAVVCMYHDQGLIPFKMIHFNDGVNTTLGLPIIRTSVDHGTAYDIAGTGSADPGSLLAAIKMAVEQIHYSALSQS